jgi:hypothetical protein
VVPGRFARAVTIDEGRFSRARYRRYAGLVRDDSASEEYSFVQLADTQFGMLPQIKTVQWLRSLRRVVSLATCGLKDGRSVIPVPLLVGEPEEEEEEATLDADALLELEIELSRKTVQAINALTPRPRFAVVCGDLVHAYPDKQPELNAEQVKIFKEVFSQVHPEIALVCVCGNHDVGDRVSNSNLRLWHERFGDDYMSFWVGRDQFIVLNTQLYKDPAAECLAAARAQDRWLDEQLFGDAERGGRRNCTVFSHVPPFIDRADEPSGYFPLAKPVRLNLLERCVQGGVGLWMAGHYHRNAGGAYKSLEVVTTAAVGGCLVSDPQGDRLGLSGMGKILGSDKVSGMRIVRVSAKGQVRHEFKTLAELLVGAPLLDDIPPSPRTLSHGAGGLSSPSGLLSKSGQALRARLHELSSSAATSPLQQHQPKHRGSSKMS